MRVSANFHLGQRPSGQVPECGCASVSASVEWGMGRTLLEALSWRVKEFMHVEEQPGTWNGSLCNHGSVVENNVTAFDYYVIDTKRSLAPQASLIHVSTSNHMWPQACQRPGPATPGAPLGLDIHVLTPSWLPRNDGLWGPLLPRGEAQ